MTTSLTRPGLFIPSGSPAVSIWPLHNCAAILNDVLTTNTYYYALLNIPLACTLTGLKVGRGGFVSGNAKVGLHTASGGTLLASSASTAIAGTLTSQRIPFSAPIVVGPGQYIIGMQADNNSATWNMSVLLEDSLSVAPGSFAVPATVTAPGISDSLYAPMMSTY